MRQLGYWRNRLTKENNEEKRVWSDKRNWNKRKMCGDIGPAKRKGRKREGLYFLDSLREVFEDEGSTSSVVDQDAAVSPFFPREDVSGSRPSGEEGVPSSLLPSFDVSGISFEFEDQGRAKRVGLRAPSKGSSGDAGLLTRLGEAGLEKVQEEKKSGGCIFGKGTPGLSVVAEKVLNGGDQKVLREKFDDHGVTGLAMLAKDDISNRPRR
ncbi:uncharacterized protein G2W53_018140 [Senna tora]|uniref:Uncharacterized protein n=1 Tax=Senna tora TaxID=362788 RepID=A0A834TUB1_9FABA|nr:uncharacterized protein G2W53_018140 [Senna tora]